MSAETSADVRPAWRSRHKFRDDGVCLVHIESFCVPVGIQHSQCLCRIFNTINRECQVVWSRNYAAYILFGVHEAE